MSATFLSNLKGATGSTGPQGIQGLPGVNAVANDAAMSTLVGTPGSATNTAMATTFGTANLVRRVVIGTNMATPRPVWAGPVNWVTTRSDRLPVYVQDGDEVTVVAENVFPWNPLYLPGLAAWYSADFVDLQGTPKVYSVTDLSDTGATMRMSTYDRRPTYNATGLNGQPALSFDGVDDFMLSDTFTTRNRPNSTQYLVIGGGDAVVSSSIYAADRGTAGGAQANGAIGRGGSNTWLVINGSTMISSAAASNNGIHVIKVAHSASTTTVSVDGIVVAGPTANAASNSYNVLSFGSRTAGTTGFFKGMIGTYIETTALLSVDDEAKLYSYLNTKYGI